MENNYFVLPFTWGIYFLLAFLLFKYGKWLYKLPRIEKLKVVKGFFSIKTLAAVKETVLESLIHRKIFKVNPVLGYMHMSLAFGWFLLILVGQFEASYYTGTSSHPIYMPIFLRYFYQDVESYQLTGLYGIVMDSLLLLILSGVLLAYIKRFNSRILGMKKTTRLKTGDKFAMSS